MRGKSISLLSVLALLTVLAIAAIWTQVIPQYQARGGLRIRPIIPRLVFDTEGSGMIPLYESFVNTQVDIVRSSKVLTRVLEQTKVRDTQWYKNPPKSIMQRLGETPPSRMERLRDALSVKAREGTEIVDVSFLDASAGDARVIVNAVLGQYIGCIAEMSDETADEVLRRLKQEYDFLKSDIDQRQNALAELRKKLRTSNPQELISAKMIRLDETQSRLTELRHRITLMEYGIDQANATDSNEVAGVEGKPGHYMDAEWRERDVKVRTICHNIATSQLNPSDPDIVQAKKDLKLAEELLLLRETQLDRQWRDRAKNGVNLPATIIASVNVYDSAEGVTSLEQKLLLAKEEEQLLQANFKEQEKEFRELFDQAELFERESAALQQKRELFNAVRQRRDQKNMERNVPSPISILSRATAPSEPYNDRRLLFTAIALGLCLVVGSGIVFLQRTRMGDGGKGRR